RLDQMRLHEEGEEAAALAELNRLRDRPPLTPVPALPALLDLPLPAVPELDGVLGLGEEASPQIGEAALGVERGRAALELARRNLKPDFMAQASYTNRGSLPPMWSLDLGVVVPLYARSRQRPAIAEAEARLRSEEAGLRAVFLKVTATAEKSL